MMRKNCLKIYLLLILLSFGVITHPSFSYAQCEITNPATTVQTSVGEYGQAREGGARSHWGVDIMIPMCVPVPNQTIQGLPCQVMMNGTSPIWKTGGYGLYARYRCNEHVEVRYAHLNGWDTGAKMPSNGRSGAAKKTPPHVHYEVIVYYGGKGVKVDPQCVWGGHPNQSKCCTGLGSNCSLGASPANMCDTSVLMDLRRNAEARKQRPKDSTALYTGKSINDGSGTRLPDQVGPGPFEKDEPQCKEADNPEGLEHEHDDAGDLEAGGELPVLQPPPYTPPEDPTDPEDPVPSDPPEPLEPGAPGDDPKLVITIPTYDGVEFKNGCATDTWTAMVNQAVIEARREDIVNKRFIVKPDSILDYGCMDENLKTAQAKLGPIFSETPNWAARSVNILGKTVIVKRYHPKGLHNALASVVENTAKSYYNQQHNQPPLAGSTPVGGATSAKNCGLMGKVWSAAKCKNFDDVKVFYKFEDLKSFEPREFPPNMKCGG